MRIVAFVFAALLLLALPARAEPRVALIIGNSAYDGDLGALPNPANDARLMAKTLKGIGFEVIEAENADQAQMKRVIQSFGERLANAGEGATGLFFYAGHGVQVGGTNYLIPIHAKIAREPDVDIEAVPVDLVMKQMAFADAAVNIVILDACRNNPLSRGFRAVTRGLADPSARPMGSFIAYSTAPGDVAEDGKGVNSAYTTALAQAITRPGASINDVFQEVRGKVLAATGKKQVPWDASSLTAPFYFVPAAVSAPAAPDPASLDLAFWNEVKDSKSAEDYQAYLGKFPDGVFAPLARRRLEQADQTATRVLHQNPEAALPATPSQADAAAFESAFWSAAEDDKSVEGYEAYLNKYPQGRFADQARQRIATLNVAPKAPLPAIVATTAKLYARDQARLREAPSIDAPVVARLAASQALEATGRSTDSAWWRVQLADGRIGFVAASVVSDRPPPPPPPQAAAAKPAALPAVAAPPPAGTDSDNCLNNTDLPSPQRAEICRRFVAAGIADETDHYNALLRLGEALFDQNLSDEAMRNYRTAVDIDPNFWGAYYLIGRVHRSESRYAEARAAFDKAVALDSTQADPLMNRGAVARRLGDFDAAEADIERAIAMKSDDPDYFDELSYLHLYKGDIAAALADTEKALALDSSYRTATGIFALYFARRFDEAIAMADRARAEDPGFLYWWIWKAMAQRARGDAAGASETLTAGRAAFGKPDWPAPLLDYIAGRISEAEARRLARSDNAKTAVEQLCEVDFYTGERLAAAGDRAGAIAAFKRAKDSRVYYYIETMVAPAWIAFLKTP
ncbi:caspase family protein [Dongia sedimenti]|uniref:Caspase family protein n=1 Tax=Dongia sedimenti TaxID=3064282 RepID=A0ABU0YLF5_9PROT|nr:caspase family protein [Rhodospirillaceae bacterium R-7]